MLPEAKRTSTMKAEIASHILACAAKGERNPTTLRIAALSAVVECTHYSHDISPPDVCDGTSAVGESRHRIPNPLVNRLNLAYNSSP